MSARGVVSAAALVALLGVGAPAVHAAQQHVLGRLIMVTDPKPADPDRRKIRVTAREPSGATTIVGDPTVGGGSLLVVVGDDPDNGSFFPLPAAGWSATAHGFTYRDSSGVYGPVRTAALRDDGRSVQVKAVLSGRQGPGTPPHLPIVPDAATEGGVQLTFVGGDTYCMQYGGAAGGTVKTSATRFRVAKPTAEAGCAFCEDEGGGVCGGFCPTAHFCAPVGGGCGCVFVLGTSTTTTSTSSTLP
jgi:hypothetical protein